LDRSESTFELWPSGRRRATGRLSLLPTDYILIARLLSPLDITNYAPGVQIDSGLLLLVTGLSSVLLPKAALAHAGGNAKTVRHYYVRGTLVSAALLLAASLFIWITSPWLLRIWFGNSMHGTRAILPLMLLNTVIGGSSAVGRSILLAVGKAKPFAISVLIAGATNVVFSYVFVRYLHWGLKGIILGTIVAVVGRCVIWMPWFVGRTLGRKEGTELQIEN
jgi:O-antigen/teichoic acid export membrane protein